MKRRFIARESAATFGLRGFLTFLLALLLLSPLRSLAAEDSICARVKLEIRQELTLERQAFDAHMGISNGFSGITLEKVQVDVRFTDEEGNVVRGTSDPGEDAHESGALFFIRLDSMENIAAVDGTGSVSPSSTADIHWLIVPLGGASKGLPQGTFYYVGATLTYTIGGRDHEMEVTPDYILVKPMPELTLDYFLPAAVYGDDPDTTAMIEEPIPFSLGLRVRNNGAGAARGLKIDSAQPRIVENEQGVLIDFVIEGCEVNGEAKAPSLLADFGDVGPEESAVARWVMRCTLSGRFEEFTAHYSHADELGGELTSLLERINTHLLLRDVLVDLPGRDGIRDFLAGEGGKYTVYESESLDTAVVDQSGSSSLNGSEDQYTLSAPVTAGFLYVRVPDPHQGEKVLKEVVRTGDGKRIKPENAWLSKTKEGSQDWQFFLNLFDVNSTGLYTVVFEDPESLSHPPVLQVAPAWTGVEGGEISFVVLATDQDADPVRLSAAPLPALASFTDQGDGEGIFFWTPARGQAGEYRITFTASDGVLQDSRRVTLTINPVDDRDGDGMLDAWEEQHFGDLTRDGNGDYDGDGISDLDEFRNGKDPTTPNQAPSLPVIASPQDGEETAVLRPDLVIHNSADPDGDEITYEFEIFSDEEIATLVARATDVAEGPEGSTSFSVPQELGDNARHFWRVRATDGFAFTCWVYGRFFVNTANDPPGSFHASSPGDCSEVSTRTPAFEVTNSRDPDEDTLTYTFEVYGDTDPATLVASSADIAAGQDGRTLFVLDTPLTDDTWYYWRAVVRDEDGETAETPLTLFLVRTENGSPGMPEISFPAPGTEQPPGELDLVVMNSTDLDGDFLSYFFELDRVNTFDSRWKQISGEIKEGSGTTRWHVSALEENTLYHWRVKASDGASERSWVTGSFFVNGENDPPLAPTIRNPGDGAWVDTPTPTLMVNPTLDPDGDGLTYRFEVYGSGSPGDPVLQGEADTREWTLPSPLSDATRYSWRVRAVDLHGQEGAWSSMAAFFVRDNGVDDPPEISILQPEEDLFTNQESILIRWEDSDPDSNAHIALYYEKDGEEGVPIAEGIDEDLDGAADTYLWNIAALADGTYDVYAVITDGAATVTGASPGRVRIDRTPPALSVEPEGGSYVSAQQVILSVDEAATIYYTTDARDPTLDSFLYTSPIAVSETKTLKALAVDRAGNRSAVLTATYTIEHEILVIVTTGEGTGLSGLRVYAFTPAGTYTGKSATTDGDGVGRFDPQHFPEGTYKFRVDYLGNRFWSEPVTLPGATGVPVLIDHETVEVAFTTGSGGAGGVRVYLFAESGTYLGRYGQTDDRGVVSFELPVGRNFAFRADNLGHQYWSDVTTVSGGGTNSVTVEAGGGLLEVALEKGEGSPLEGVRVYLFNACGFYLGRYQQTDSSGVAGFDVTEGLYRVRADYLGYQFWSDATFVMEDTRIELPIPHQPVRITVQGRMDQAAQPLEGLRVYLFTPAGSYLGRYEVTDLTGRVVFDLLELPYRVRADYLGRQFWSDLLPWQNTTVELPMADVEVSVSGAGFPREGVRVYLFTASGLYLGLWAITGEDGKVQFRVPEGVYKFRVDYQGSQYWSAEETFTAHRLNPVMVSVGGGPFTVTVFKGAGEPLAGVKCYVFNESEAYLGLWGATDSQGNVSFELADGAYKFRVDYMGNRFWSEAVVIPGAAEASLLIEHETVEVALAAGFGPAQGVKVYLFGEGRLYLGVYGQTDDRGMVSFELPVGRNFAFRADTLGHQYWSELTTVSGGETNRVAVEAGGGLLEVALEKGEESPMEGIRVYLFNASGLYLGRYQVTDPSGMAAFDVTEGLYKVRADYLGYQFWSDVTPVAEDTRIELPIPHQPARVTVEGRFDESVEPLEGLKVYLFSPAGSYLGSYAYTDPSGRVSFELPEQPYKVRADYLGLQFWSEVAPFEDATVTVEEGLANIHVHRSGSDVAGVKVHLFSGGGTYLSWSQVTDARGRAQFRLPNRSFRFRVDEGGNQYWSQVIPILAGEPREVNFDLQRGACAASPDPSQMVSLAPEGASQTRGSTFRLTAAYSTTDDENRLSGMIVNFHFDSRRLEFLGFSNLFEGGLALMEETPREDVENLDGDSSTDKFVKAFWLDLAGGWPASSLPLNIAELVFTVKTNAPLGAARVNVSSAGMGGIQGTASGYGFCCRNAVVTVTASP